MPKYSGGTSPADAAKYEAQYARRTGVTVAQLHARGQVAEPCPCGDAGCPGWRMTPATPGGGAAPAPAP
jgi:hypothetical protein